jgi:hypothetical protein
MSQQPRRHVHHRVTVELNSLLCFLSSRQLDISGDGDWLRDKAYVLWGELV